MIPRHLLLVLTLLLFGLPVAAGVPAVPISSSSVLVSQAKKRKKRRRKRKKRPRKRKRKKAAKPAIKAPEPKPEPKAAPEPTPEPAPALDESAPELPGVAVLDMELVEGVSDGVAKLVNELMLTRIAKAKVFGSVIGSSDIAQMISLEQQKTMLGCDEESCIAQLGGALGVPLMIVPGMGKLGNDYVMTLKITDVEAAQVKVRQSITVPDEPAMAKGMEWLVDASLAEFQGKAVLPAPKLERTVALVEAEQGGALKVVGKAGIALAVVGVGVAGGVHFGVVAPAQQAFKDQPTRANYENAKAAMDTGNMGLAGGLALSATGGLLWFLFAN
ncbi:MAG: hypothetical protein CMH50_12455 [Myxococcales bacterium]|nr:hypothetical protein [Myxococcales bacterium]